MKICLITNLFKPYEGWPKLHPEMVADELSRKIDFMDFTVSRWFVTLEDTMEV